MHMSSRVGAGRRGHLSILSTAIAAALAAPAAPLFAQDSQSLEEIMVTGSRVRMSDGFTNPVPLTTMTTEELFDFAPGSSVAEQLDALPQFFGNVSLENTPTGLTSSSGSTSLDLRNLGANRTLVLFDGYRMVPSSKEGAVHVDFFPTALVRSVDVVTGGASAAYGADAVGGVTNFVIDRQFEGFKMNASTGMNEFGDGERWTLSMAGGRRFGDRLNVIASFDARYIAGFTRNADEVSKQQRVGWVTNPAWNPNDPPGTNPIRITLPNVGTTANSVYGLITGTGTPLDWHRFTPDGSSLVPFDFGDVSSVSGPNSTQSMSGGVDAAIFNQAYGGGVSGTKGESRSGFIGLQYEVSDTFSLFGQYMRGRTIASDTLQRGGILLYGNWAPTVYKDNAFLPENVRQIMDDYGLESFRLQKNGSLEGVPELGLGTTDLKLFDTSSWSAGFDWDLGFKDWHVRGVYQKGVTERYSSFGSRWRMDRAFLAMDAVRHPETGAIVCRVQLFNPTPEQLAASPAVQGRISPRSAPGATKPGDPGAIPLASPIGLDNTVRDCVPYNIMGAGNISQQALDYIHGPSPKIAVGEVKQDFAELLLNGNLAEGWAGPINFAAGLTWREQDFWDDNFPEDVNSLGPPLNDPALGIQGIPSGYTGGSAILHYISGMPRLSGDMSVWEYFGELIVPVWEGNVFGHQQDLSLDLAYRRSDYERSGAVDSWKVGIDFQVLDTVRLRFTQSADVREPTFSELYDFQGTNGAVRDPRFGNTEVQISMVNGGNPDLKPEEADTVTAGIVWTPTWSFLDGLQVSLDWYDVTIDGAVSSLGAQRIVDECFRNNVQSLCAQIETNGPNGEITRLYNTFLNVAQATVEGTDLEIAYRFEPNFFANENESFSIRGLAGYVRERTDTPLGGRATDRSGVNGSPDLTGVLTATYNVGPYSFQMQGRYTDSLTIDGTWVEGIDVDKNKLPSYTWWSARIGYSGETSTGATWRVGLNIQNVFDKDPIIVPNVSTRFAIQGLAGDTLGRRYNINFDYSF